MEMGSYQVKFLTQKGIITMTISKYDNLTRLASKIKEKYGNFVTLNSNKL